MQLRSKRSWICVAANGVTDCSGSAIALAKNAGKITPVKRDHAGATALAKTIFVNKKALANARFSLVPPDGSPAAIAYSPKGQLGGFSRTGSRFAILSTGCATYANHRNTSGSSGCRDGGPVYDGARDVTILRIGMRVPKGTKCLSFRFRFLSEEYPEFVHSPYNDAFIAELDHTTWRATSVNSPKIIAPDSFARDSKGNLISINATGDASVSKARARGTTYDAATRILRASTPITPGNHRLYLSIFDQRDRQYDSAVFLDNLTLNRRSPCKPGIVKSQ